MTSKIHLSAPDVGPDEETAILRAIKSGWVAPLGPEVDAFELEIASRVGVKHGIALGSGTAALHLGLLGLGVMPGDIVITATMTFVATANAILYTGAIPFFVDCEVETGNISPELLEEAIVRLRHQGKSIGAVVPVDLLGKAVDYTAITAITTLHGIPLLADAAESLGASHAGRPAGGWGDASVVSFNGNKIMTTSGGGMLLTNTEKLAKRARYLASQARQPSVHYEHTEIGYNYRLSNILAALGRAQLSRLDLMIARRRQTRQEYRDVFESVPGVKIFGGSGDQEDNCWLTSIVVDPATSSWEPSDLSRALAAQNIETRPLWKPMHIQPLFFDAPSLIDGSSEYLFAHGLTLPSSSGMSEEAKNRIFSTVATFVAGR